MSDALMVFAGSDFSFIVNHEGTYTAFGDNSHGQLGSGGQQSQSITLEGIPPTAQFGNLTITQDQTIQLEGIPPSEHFGDLTIRQDQTITIEGIAPTTRFGNLSITQVQPPQPVPAVKCLQVLDENEQTVAYLTPNDGVSNCQLDLHLDPTAVSQMTFNITPGPKLQYLTKGAYVLADGHRFVIRRPPKQTVAATATYLVTAVEDWTSLGRYYPTVQAGPGTTIPYSVSILATDGNPRGYAPGSAASALDYLLHGCSSQMQVVGSNNTVIMEPLDTGWIVGTVDVAGAYDLVFKQKTLLEAIDLVQSTWGGYLVWDSVNRTISLRDEDLWQPGNGFGLIIGKNQKQYTVEVDQDVSTRIIPYGANGLSIASMNDDVPYVENFSYSTDVTEEVWTNNNITDQIQLFNAAQVYLSYRCTPQYIYTTDMLDLRTIPGYEQETFALGDIANLWTEDQGVIPQRIVGLTYDYFCPWICKMVLGVIGYTADRAIAAMLAQLAAIPITNNQTLPASTVAGGTYIEHQSAPWNAGGVTFTLVNGYTDKPDGDGYSEDGNGCSMVYVQATVDETPNCYSAVTVTPLVKTAPPTGTNIVFKAICTGAVKR
jgi:hypothetical protein